MHTETVLIGRVVCELRQCTEVAYLYTGKLVTNLHPVTPHPVSLPYRKRITYCEATN